MIWRIFFYLGLITVVLSTINSTSSTVSLIVIAGSFFLAAIVECIAQESW